MGFLRWLLCIFHPSNCGALKFMTSLKVGQFAKLSLLPETSSGAPAKVDGLPTWELEGAGVVEIQAESDGFTVTVTAVGAGQASVYATVDADLGDGVRLIRSGVSFVVTSDEAQSLKIGVEVTDPDKEIEIKKRG
jgi:hypothetical protein